MPFGHLDYELDEPDSRCLQVGTANFAEPPAALRVLEELKVLLASLGFSRVKDAVGCLEPIPAEPEYRGEGAT